MADKLKGVGHIIPVHSQESGGRQHSQQEKRHDQEKCEQTECHFQELLMEAKEASRILKEKQVPFRFTLYRENGDILIDIFILDPAGNVMKKITRNITHEEFRLWLNNIRRQEGLLMDQFF